MPQIGQPRCHSQSFPLPAPPSQSLSFDKVTRHPSLEWKPSSLLDISLSRRECLHHSKTRTLQPNPQGDAINKKGYVYTHTETHIS